ncbi:MAG: helix-turn-helix domain-containing protein [Gemmatimonadaceae bacterium]
MAEHDRIFKNSELNDDVSASNGHVSTISRPETDSAESDSGNAVSMSKLIMLPFTEARARALEEFDRKFLSAALARHNGNIARTARSLGLHRQSLQKLMGRRGIKSVRTPATASAAIPDPSEKE